ncbi:alpha/beta hydrolase [Halomicroarcula sp. GCM10025709]|uniref:alpha/beta hydrolase n=1 Tax=Haloarcula TaxID=2237 RepID=UPI0024C28A58|nr:alpha/beta hydrolase [Halomicroarcula sp. YJ-61-S]
MTDPVHVPGGRRVVGSLDAPDADAAVVACPPHPQQGGSRSDPRLRAVGDALGPDLACLRIDYGPWDEGRGERIDAENALAWAADRYDAVGLFGYSFGAAVALRAAASLADGPVAPRACSVLAPPAGLTGQRDAAEAVDAVPCPLQVVYGDRDEAVAWGPVVERARDRGAVVESVAAGHGFAGHAGTVADLIAPFFRLHLVPER